jgi:hypothetical protein
MNGVNQADYEAKLCAAKKSLRGDKLGKFKMTMNQKGTSGTLSISSLLYYHFSRYFDTMVEVPVAVQRTLDKNVLLNRVVSKAHGTGMNAAAWAWLKKVIPNPEVYNPTDDLFTEDRKEVYGVILDDKGDRYGVEINSARKAGWGAPQVEEFQNTPAFSPLRKDAPVADSIKGQSYPEAQMMYWARELSEIVLLDQIFSQQDRVGNIDFTLQWYWVNEAGEVTHRKADTSNIAKDDLTRADMKLVKVPDDIAAFKPILLQRTAIGDNDAGGDPRYANFFRTLNKRDPRTKKIIHVLDPVTESALGRLRHFNGGEYTKLQAMAADFQSNGPLLQNLKSQFGLSNGELKMVTNNTIEAAMILKTNCQAGKLMFDLEPSKYLSGKPVLQNVACE